MGNLREANYRAYGLSVNSLNHKKAWAFNGRIAEHHDHLADVSLASRSVSRSGTTHVGPTRCTSTVITFGSRKRTGCSSTGNAIPICSKGRKANLVFIADNPGFWLFHCHMLEHHAAGMGAVIRVS